MTVRKQLLVALSVSVTLAVAAGTAGSAAGVRSVLIQDQCDPATFNAVVGPGTCVGHNGGVHFDTFIAELQKTQKAGAWHFAPGEVHLQSGEAFDAHNDGGETHTFTEVDEFGGGIVPILNQLSGNPVEAEECKQLGPGDFVRPGHTTTPDVESPGVHHYQCCIHPWMRTDVIAQ